MLHTAQTYWRNYSFGELPESAKMRKQVLERLIPKLNIAARCSFGDKFLVVKGDLRTYKIHLGSGNILMAPNDQYLYIVADGKVFLPFRRRPHADCALEQSLHAGQRHEDQGPVDRQPDWAEVAARLPLSARGSYQHTGLKSRAAMGFSMLVTRHHGTN